VRDIDERMYIGFVRDMIKVTAIVFIIAPRRKDEKEREGKCKSDTQKLGGCEKNSSSHETTTQINVL